MNRCWTWNASLGSISPETTLDERSTRVSNFAVLQSQWPIHVNNLLVRWSNNTGRIARMRLGSSFGRCRDDARLERKPGCKYAFFGSRTYNHTSTIYRLKRFRTINSHNSVEPIFLFHDANERLADSERFPCFVLCSCSPSSRFRKTRRTSRGTRSSTDAEGVCIGAEREESEARFCDDGITA